MADMILEARPDINVDLTDEEIAQGDMPTEEMLVNMGPQHPATHGVLRVVLRTDGEMVLEAVPHIGYLHRCAEKIGENVAPYQYIPYTDRMDYLAGMNDNLAFAVAVEKLAGLEVSKRAQIIRVIFAELNRIASHLVSMGTYGLDIGAFTPFLYAFREREMILDLFESACGARLTYSYITVGGVTQDLPDRFIDLTEEFLDYFEPKIDEYNNLLSYNHIFVKRTANIGVISAADAIAFGLTGPCLRASGVRWDLRKVQKDLGYDEYEFDVPIGEGLKGKVGDCWDRYFVRILEMKQSVRILRQALQKLRGTEGDVLDKKGKTLKLPADEIYYEMENPRGQLGFFVQGNGSAIPARVKARGPSFCNLSITSQVCTNCLLADVAAIIGSIDVVMGEVDR
ncbi:MAG: NADH-quinone oxidoreductase subunit D [Phycisphaerae bacterium]|nr:MAG: NADH-quinone oxidoreductase subunit D [Planctomycetia bacterium]RIK69422.1 MAG: NADH-quinone oxidoreductase subunit D [Planctomycetota bacterium]GJQ28008.1 MAG: NADH-quinone oxidoreductase subunit D [Phycisphaerae bacterium]